MQLLSDLLAYWPDWRLPPALVSAMFGMCSVLALLCSALMIRRIKAARRHEGRHAANLFAVRELASYALGDNPVDLDHLRATLEDAPIAAVLQFLRLHRGATQAMVIAQAELAGVFDPALEALGCGVVSREVEALKTLQFARGPRFRSAVLRQVIRGSTPMLRVEALYTFVAMGTTPAAEALAAWIDGTGPDLTPRHQALFQLVADRLPEALPDLARLVTARGFQDQLAVLAAQHDTMHHHPHAIGPAAARLRAPIHPARRSA